MPTDEGAPPSSTGDRPRAFGATLGLGSNLGDRVRNIDQAITLLTENGAVSVVSRSRRYRTAPWGVTDQDWFVNACVSIKSTLSPRQVLRHCQSVEDAMGRVRTMRWGPRNIDVDILTFGDLKIYEPDLVIPHPLIAERAFVLIPLKDVAPDLKINGASLDAMLSKLNAGDVRPLDA